jgi:hypothetical protein
MVPGFMPGIVPRIMCRSVPQMAEEVRRDDRVGRVLERRVRDLVEVDVADAAENDSFHGELRKGREGTFPANDRHRTGLLRAPALFRIASRSTRKNDGGSFLYRKNLR